MVDNAPYVVYTTKNELDHNQGGGHQDVKVVELAKGGSATSGATPSSLILSRKDENV